MSQHPFSTDFDIYLDIDGVIKGVASPDAEVRDFLEYLLKEFPERVYWLTSHCHGGVNSCNSALRDTLPEGLRNRVCKYFEPTDWGLLKTDGINFTRDFLWFDDTMFQSEIDVLEEHGVEDNFCLVMSHDPNSTHDMMQCIQDKIESRGINTGINAITFEWMLKRLFKVHAEIDEDYRFRARYMGAQMPDSLREICNKEKELIIINLDLAIDYMEEKMTGMEFVYFADTLGALSDSITEPRLFAEIKKLKEKYANEVEYFELAPTIDSALEKSRHPRRL